MLCGASTQSSSAGWLYSGQWVFFRYHLDTVFTQQAGGQPLTGNQFSGKAAVVDHSAATGRGTGFQDGLPATLRQRNLQHRLGTTHKSGSNIDPALRQHPLTDDFCRFTRGRQASQLFRADRDQLVRFFQAKQRCMGIALAVPLAGNALQASTDQ